MVVTVENMIKYSVLAESSNKVQQMADPGKIRQQNMMVNGRSGQRLGNHVSRVADLVGGI